ncbi:MAG: hypothetical protein H6862_07380 [Rhodospirillales bacterium]|nr:hypothetical protein [Rhodospirillales bacterium]
MAEDIKPKKTDKSRNIAVAGTPDKSRDAMIAELAMGGIVNGATLAVDFSKGNYGELSLTDCIDELARKTRAVHKGNLQDAETLLTAQAFALDAIFMSLARRAALNMGEYLDAADRYMRLALKAQGQCRATLETLANIKNPPVIVARQANIAHGPQQVNNTVNKTEGGFQTSTHAGARAGNSKSVQNELLEDKSHEAERMDFGTAGATGRGDPALATMDKIHRPAQS